MVGVFSYLIIFVAGCLSYGFLGGIGMCFMVFLFNCFFSARNEEKFRDQKFKERLILMQEQAAEKAELAEERAEKESERVYARQERLLDAAEEQATKYEDIINAYHKRLELAEEKLKQAKVNTSHLTKIV